MQVIAPSPNCCCADVTTIIHNHFLATRLRLALALPRDFFPEQETEETNGSYPKRDTDSDP